MSATEAGEFEPFVRRFERRILNYLWRMTGEEQSAYDLTQEVFFRAWQRFATISHYDQPRAWLFRVATNLAVTYNTGRSRWTGRLSNISLFAGDDAPGASGPRAALCGDRACASGAAAIAAQATRRARPA